MLFRASGNYKSDPWLQVSMLHCTSVFDTGWLSTRPLWCCLLSVLLPRKCNLKIWSGFCHLELQDLFTVISCGYFVKWYKKGRWTAYKISNVIGGKYYVGRILSVDYNFYTIFGWSQVWRGCLEFPGAQLSSVRVSSCYQRREWF